MFGRTEKNLSIYLQDNLLAGCEADCVKSTFSKVLRADWARIKWKKPCRRINVDGVVSILTVDSC